MNSQKEPKSKDDAAPGVARKDEAKPRFPWFLQLVVLLTLFPGFVDFSLFTDFAAPFNSPDEPDRKSLSTELEQPAGYDLEFPKIRGRKFESYSERARNAAADSFLAWLNPGGGVLSKEQTVPFCAFILYPFALIVSLVRFRPGWFVFGLIVPHSILAIGLLRELGAITPEHDLTLVGLYAIVSKIAFVWILLKGRLLWLCLILLPIFCPSPGPFYGWPLDGEFNVKYFLVTLSPFFIFWISVGVIRFTWLAISQNLMILWKLGIWETPLCLVRTTIYWIPLLTVVILGDRLYMFVYEKAVDGLYDIPIVELSNGGLVFLTEGELISHLADVPRAERRPAIDTQPTEDGTQREEDDNWKRWLIVNYSGEDPVENVEEDIRKTLRARVQRLVWNVEGDVKDSSQEVGRVAAEIAAKIAAEVQKIKDLDIKIQAEKADLIDEIGTAGDEAEERLQGYIDSVQAEIKKETPITNAVMEVFNDAFPTRLPIERYEHPSWTSAAGENAVEPGINLFIEMLQSAYWKVRQEAKYAIKDGLEEPDAEVLAKLKALETELKAIKADIAENASGAQSKLDALDFQLFDSDQFDGADAHLDRVNEVAADVEVFYLNAVYNAINSGHELGQESISASVSFIKGGQLVSDYLLLYLCLRSFLYVFARVALRRDVRARIDFSTRATRKTELVEPVAISHHGRKYSLSDDLSRTWYFSRKLEPHGAPPVFSIPQAGKAALGRLRNGVWAMNKFDVEAGKGMVHFTSVGAAEYVEWNLREGERVIFDYRNFVGMSDSITLHGLTSLRISTLVLGRVLFPVAEGPGTIVLQTKGVALTGEDPETRMAVPSGQLIAWNQNCKFSVESKIGFADVYLSSAYVKIDGTGNVIVDADQAGAAKTGLSRFIRYFISPF